MNTKKTRWWLLGGTVGMLVVSLVDCSGETSTDATGKTAAAQEGSSAGGGGTPASRGDDVPVGCVQFEINREVDGSITGRQPVPLVLPDDVEPAAKSFDLYLISGRFDDCATIGTKADACDLDPNNGLVETYNGPRLLVASGVQRVSGQPTQVVASLNNLFPSVASFQATIQWCVAEQGGAGGTAGSGGTGGSPDVGGSGGTGGLPDAGGAGGAPPVDCGDLGEVCCDSGVKCNAGQCAEDNTCQPRQPRECRIPSQKRVRGVCVCPRGQTVINGVCGTPPPPPRPRPTCGAEGQVCCEDGAVRSCNFTLTCGEGANERTGAPLYKCVKDERDGSDGSDGSGTDGGKGGILFTLLNKLADFDHILKGYFL